MLFAKLLAGGRPLQPNPEEFPYVSTTGRYLAKAVVPTGQEITVLVVARLGYLYGTGNSRNYDKLSPVRVGALIRDAKPSNRDFVSVPVTRSEKGWRTLDSFYCPNPFYGVRVAGWNNDGTAIDDPIILLAHLLEEWVNYCKLPVQWLADTRLYQVRLEGQHVGFFKGEERISEENVATSLRYAVEKGEKISWKGTKMSLSAALDAAEQSLF